MNFDTISSFSNNISTKNETSKTIIRKEFLIMVMWYYGCPDCGSQNFVQSGEIEDNETGYEVGEIIYTCQDCYHSFTYSDLMEDMEDENDD